MLLNKCTIFTFPASKNISLIKFSKVRTPNIAYFMVKWLSINLSRATCISGFVFDDKLISCNSFKPLKKKKLFYVVCILFKRKKVILGNNSGKDKLDLYTFCKFETIILMKHPFERCHCITIGVCNKEF